MTDNLSKSLQATKMSAIKGRKSADLVITTLKDIRKDDQFQLFYDAVKKVANSIKVIAQQAMPRKRKRPIIQSSNTS